MEEDIKKLEKITNSVVSDIAEKTSTNTKRKRNKIKKKKWKNFSDHSNIYVTGLPLDIKEEDFVEYFSKCGIIRRDPLTDAAKVKLYRDKSGNYKGDGLVSYLKSESVQLAIDMLDESFITPEKKIRVQKAEFKMKGDEFIEKKERDFGNVVKKITNRKIAKAKDQNKELCWDDEQESEMAARAGLRIVILKPMFDLEEVESSGNAEQFYEELAREVGVECERVGGPIDKLTVFEGSGSGAIAIKFKTPSSAAKCIGEMDARFFGGRSITCEYFDGTDYRAKAEESEREQKKRIEEFGKWLEEN